MPFKKKFSQLEVQEEKVSCFARLIASHAWRRPIPVEVVGVLNWGEAAWQDLLAEVRLRRQQPRKDNSEKRGHPLEAAGTFSDEETKRACRCCWFAAYVSMVSSMSVDNPFANFSPQALGFIARIGLRLFWPIPLLHPTPAQLAAHKVVLLIAVFNVAFSVVLDLTGRWMAKESFCC